MLDFTVGIPTVNHHELLVKAIDSICDNTVRPTRVIVIDNGDIKPWIPSLWEVPVHVVRPQQNLGVAASWNLLMKLISPMPAIIMNDDCVLGEGVLEKMMGYPSPAVVCAHGFACFRLDQEIRKKVGDFDEEFYPAYYEDADYRYRLKLEGIPYIDWDTATNDIQHGKDHLNFQKWNVEKMAWFHKRLAMNYEYYLKKWGGGIEAEVFTSPFNL